MNIAASSNKLTEITSYPLRVLECPDEKVDQPGDRPVLPEGGVVGRAEGQVADQPDHRLHEGPPGTKIIFL